MQIASQPSAESAKSTYQDLAAPLRQRDRRPRRQHRQGRIAGKGTFWRVRVPAKSRNDAINLCNELQGRRRQLLRLEVAVRPIQFRRRRGIDAAPFFVVRRPVATTHIAAADVGLSVNGSRTAALLLQLETP